MIISNGLVARRIFGDAGLVGYCIKQGRIWKLVIFFDGPTVSRSIVQKSKDYVFEYNTLTELRAEAERFLAYKSWN